MKKTAGGKNSAKSSYRTGNVGSASDSRLSRLQHIARSVSQAGDINTALGIIVSGVKQAMGVDVCSVYLSDEEQGYHLLMASEGLNPAVVGQLKLSLDEGLVGLVAERSEPVNVRNAASHPRYRYVPSAGEEAYHAFLGVPVIHQGELLGVLVVQQLAVRRFKESDVAFLVTLAAQLAGGIALAKARSALSAESATQIPSTVTSYPYVEVGAGAPGVGLGVAVVACVASELSQVPDRDILSIDDEELRFRSAVVQLAQMFETIGKDPKTGLTVEDRALFDAYAMMVRSDEMVETTVRRIRQGNWAPGALRDTIEEHVRVFEGMDDPYLRSRADDIREIGRQLLSRLFDEQQGSLSYPEQTILVGDNLSVVDLAAVPVEQLVAVISGHGSNMSHVAIMARSLGVPAVMGVGGDLPVSALDGRELIVDGYQGRIYLEPKGAVKREFQRLIRQERQLSAELQQLRDLPAVSCDGIRTHLYTNIGLLSDLNTSLSVGAEGIGLYRSEFPFMIRSSFPTEDEQVSLYRQVLSSVAPHPVTLRTLDVGGDKGLPYFPIHEANPFLGWRGIRISLDHPEIFLTQVRAALRADIGLGNLKILLPMISGVDDLDQAIALIRRAFEQLTEAGVAVRMPQLGAMVEVPSAAYQARALARRVDFLSVGSNDLTQYLLAVDRNNERVSRWFDALHPAVIAALMQVVEAGKAHGKCVSVCGEAAGDPAMAVLLLGMGVDSLSLNAGDLPRIKWLIRTLSRSRCEALLQQSLEMDRAVDIRALLTQALMDLGLGGLVRPGR